MFIYRQKLKFNLRLDDNKSVNESEVTRVLGSEYNIPDSRNINLRNAFDQMVAETGVDDCRKYSASEDFSSNNTT